MYLLEGSDLIFKDWEQVERFIQICQENLDKYSWVDETDFVKCHFWEE